MLLEKCQARVDEVQREIDGLRMKRREVETSLEGIISTLNNTIDVRARTGRARIATRRSCCTGPRHRRLGARQPLAVGSQELLEAARVAAVIADAPDGAILDIKVIPRAGRTGVAGTRDGALLVRLTAAPVDGAANAELIDFLADAARCSQNAASRRSPATRAARKRVKVMGVSAAAVSQRLDLAYDGR